MESTSLFLFQTGPMLSSSKQQKAHPKTQWYQFTLRSFLLISTISSPLVCFYAAPRLMVAQFLNDANRQNLDRAYARTSESFQGYISRTNFESYAASMFTDDLKLDFGRIGVTDEGERALFVGIYQEGERCSRFVFVWDSGWKFKHHSDP